MKLKQQMKSKYLKCVSCGDKIKIGESSRCKNHLKYYNHLNLIYDCKSIRRFPFRKKGLLRYSDLLPLQKEYITLGEGFTPLATASNIGKKLGISKLYIKNETINPTGSFKDRENYILINLALEKSVTELNIASCGNAAISLAAYCKKAGIRCNAYIPKKASKQKKEFLRFLGANINEVNANYEGTYRLAYEKKSNQEHIIEIIKDEGSKTIAFEIAEQLGVPDYIIVPIGNGSNIAAIFKGFLELKLIGKTKKLPKMIGVEVEHSNCVAKAVENNQDHYIHNNTIYSKADAITGKESFSAPKAIWAIKKSDGFVVTLAEDEIDQVKQLLRHEHNINAEHSSWGVFAAAKTIKFEKNARIVAILTGCDKKILLKNKKNADNSQPQGSGI
ncbi:MAG: pyridoxal-phosphate dependent enzyme [Candidatus Woesearchaeota archaeon]